LRRAVQRKHDNSPACCVSRSLLLTFSGSLGLSDLNPPVFERISSLKNEKHSETIFRRNFVNGTDLPPETRNRWCNEKKILEDAEMYYNRRRSRSAAEASIGRERRMGVSVYFPDFWKMLHMAKEKGEK
jgi:hypothetical protein